MGVAKSPEGIVYFIKNTIPGDIVDVNPYKKRKGYIEAEPIKWVTKSTKERILNVTTLEYVEVANGKI